MKRKWWLLLTLAVIGIIVWLEMQRRAAAQFKRRLWVALKTYLPAKKEA